MDALTLKLQTYDGCDCKSEVFELCHTLLDTEAQAFKVPYLSFQESRTPCGLPLFETSQAVLYWVYQQHYEFCEPNQAHWYLERGELE